jgi:hypothetical protein
MFLVIFAMGISLEYLPPSRYPERNSVMPPQNPSEERNPYERRFERIEAALAALAENSQKATEILFKATDGLADGYKQLLTAQVIMADAQTKAEQQIAALAEAQAKSELAQAETQGKLDALIHMWDEMIRERGRKNGEPQQPPAG